LMTKVRQRFFGQYRYQRLVLDNKHTQPGWSLYQLSPSINPA
jgi:hypothetical protein